MTAHAVWEEIPVSFEIIIPDGLELSNETYDGSMAVLAEISYIPPTSRITVMVSSEHNFHLVERSHASIMLPYALRVNEGEPLSQNAEVVNFTMENDLRRADLAAQVTEMPKYSGSYADSLTFTVKFEEI